MAELFCDCEAEVPHEAAQCCSCGECSGPAKLGLVPTLPEVLPLRLRLRDGLRSEEWAPARPPLLSAGDAAVFGELAA